MALSRQILARSDVSLPALRWAWDRAAAMGSFEESEALRDRVLTRARSTPVDLLTAAWRTQFSRRPHKFAASWARRGNEQLLDRAPDGLLVEAMLLASSRELHTARQRRDAARSQRPTGPVSPRLWLVQGRIAQQEGLTDMARSYYRRAMQAPAERADSEAALAARWLKGLGGPSASSP